MTVCHLPYGPTVRFSLSNVVMRHDIENKGTVSEQYPHLIFENFQSSLGDRISTVLKYLFPVPREESKRVITFANENDFISFRHHVFQTTPGKGADHVDLKEVGPRLEMQPFEMRLGTFDQTDAQVEWRLHNYTRTAKNKQVL